MGDPDADMDAGADEADPQFAADCSDIFPDFTPEQCRMLQDLIDDRVSQKSSKPAKKVGKGMPDY